MSTIRVDLPQDLLEFVQLQVQRGEFASAGEYIVALVDAARNQKSEIETALLAGLKSGPAEEWTTQEWADIKQRLIERHAEGGG
jgi:Arc/MetJ-type ribon-helix-helix transcriptional regulator